MAKSDWRELDINSELSAACKHDYLAAKDAYKIYKALRNKFEQAMQDEYSEQLQDDEELKFGYNFGKLSVAIGEKRERKPRKEAKPSESFADWLKGQRESGHNH